MLTLLGCTIVLTDVPCDTGQDSAVSTETASPVETGDSASDSAAETGSDTSGDSGQDSGRDTGPVDADDDGFPADADCDDDDPGVNPDATEICDDGVDNDCDGTSNDCGPSGDVALSTAVLQLTGNQPSAGAGIQVASAGDQGGDGLPDLVVAEVGAGSAYEGALFVVGGSASGARVLSREVGSRIEHADAYANLGASIALLGDHDGDGWDDLLVGAPGDHYVQSPVGGPNEDAGEAFLLLGPLSTSGTVGVQELAAARIQGANTGSYYGLGTAGGRYADGSGRLVVSGPGASSDLGDVVVITGTGELSTADAELSVKASTTNGSFGGQVALGDLDGDGLTDLIASAPGWRNPLGGTSKSVAGEVFAVLGEQVGALTTADADWRVEGAATEDGLGSALSLGDHDADGYVDVLVGAFGVGGDSAVGVEPRGAAYLFAGPVTAATTPGSAAASWEGEAAWALGLSADLAGDVDGDGRADVLLGVWNDDDGAGQTFLDLGPLSGTGSVTRARAAYTGSSAEASGFSVAHVPDVDGDGHGEVFIGAPGHSGSLAGNGAAYLLSGTGL